jgi:hypothetical protein
MISIYNKTATQKSILVKGRVVAIGPSNPKSGVIGAAQVTEKEADYMMKQAPRAFTLNFIEAKGTKYLFESPFGPTQAAVLNGLTIAELKGVIRFLSGDSIDKEQLSEKKTKEECVALAESLVGGFLPHGFKRKRGPKAKK